MKTGKKLFALTLVLALMVPLLAGCSLGGSNAYGTLVLGADEFNGVFSPFFGTTGYDMEISDLVHAPLITNDRSGAPMSSLAEYATPKETKDADGKVTETVYTFKLVDGVKFSDGSKITAEDILFSYYVYLDPYYDGASTVYTTPIKGVNEYRYDDANYAAKLEEIATQANAITDEEVKAYITKTAPGDIKGVSNEDLIAYLKFDNKDKLEGDKLTAALTEAYVAYEIANYLEDYKSGAIDAKKKTLEDEYIKANLTGGTDVTEISGIKKIDDRTVEVTIEGVDPKAIWNLGGISVVPKAYYGTDFAKGKLDGVKALNGTPMGAGPYKFVSFEDNVVTLESNDNYFKGAPTVATIKYQVTDTSDKFAGVQTGQYDISNPTASPDMVEQCKATANIDYRLIDNLGYGYIGINAERVTDANVRKGLMSLMNRDPAVQSYYGELASVIERPMSKVSWAYPENANRVYSFDAAKALEFFKAAGYTQVTKNGKTVLEKNGKQLSVQIAIGGDGKMDHPSAPILTEMKTQLEKLGGVLDIQDVDGSILFDKLHAGGWDMWVAAWSATIDPDMYQTYHSQGPSNYYKIKDATLDKLIMEARQTNDVEVRKAKYLEALDIIMDYAVEMPVYQRKNMYIFNKDNIDVTTLPEDMTPFYGYFREIETLKMVEKAK